MNKTNIPYVTHTWNPVTGCTPVSEGCEHCYAEKCSRRFNGLERGKFNPDYFKVTLHPDRLSEPLLRRKPARIFVCSMSDLFHPDVPDEFIDEVWATMALSHQHTFLVLTKRPQRMKTFIEHMADPRPSRSVGGIWPNIWLGVTAENQARADERIPILLQTPAAKRFVSIEPMLGPVDLTNIFFREKTYSKDALRRSNLEPPWIPDAKLDWVIVGGESGPGARECREEWVQSVYDQCQAAGVPFFFKQGGHNFVRNCESPEPCEPAFPEACNTCPNNGQDWMKRREWPK